MIVSLSRLSPCLAVSFLTFSLAACDNTGRFTHAEPGEAQSAGSATVVASAAGASNPPLANLSATHQVAFAAAAERFQHRWTAAEGLGPLFNAASCQACHTDVGSTAPASTADASTVLSIAAAGQPAYAKEIQKLAAQPEPNYGRQLQNMAIPGVTPEGRFRSEYTPVFVALDDGTKVQLRKPQLAVEGLSDGALSTNARLSARMARPLLGLGLLEAIAERDILINAGPRDDRTGTIAGRPNWVWDAAQQKTVLGRFGWKAAQPTLAQMNASMFATDMGLTSSVNPHDDCSATQTACKVGNSGAGDALPSNQELSDAILQQMQFYTRVLSVPARRAVDDKQVIAGKNLFYRANCQACHIPQFTTRADAAEPELANQTIRPFTDLLVHNMGDGLADTQAEFQANGNDWRTPPLWGLGLSDQAHLLHDGRARNVMEAVLWHGGEALGAQREVLSFNAQQREALLAFLNSL